MFSYAEAETILARLHGADEAVQKGAFRARLKHLKRLGIPLNSSPGRGKKVDYDIEHVCQWAFCLELEQMGLDPSLIVEFVKYNWSNVYDKGFEKGTRQASSRIFFYCEPFVMTASWGGKSPGVFNQLGATGIAPLDEVVENLRTSLNGGRLSAVDLSRILEAIQIEEIAIKQNWQQS